MPNLLSSEGKKIVISMHNFCSDSQMLDIVDTAIPQLHTTTLVHFFEKKD